MCVALIGDIKGYMITAMLSILAGNSCLHNGLCTDCLSVFTRGGGDTT